MTESTYSSGPHASVELIALDCRASRDRANKRHNEAVLRAASRRRRVRRWLRSLLGFGRGSAAA